MNWIDPEGHEYFRQSQRDIWSWLGKAICESLASVAGIYGTAIPMPSPAERVGMVSTTQNLTQPEIRKGIQELEGFVNNPDSHRF